MEKFSGLTLTEKEKLQILQDVEKLKKFFKNEPDIFIKYEAEHNGDIKATIKTTYFGTPVYTSETDSNKIGATKKSIDSAVRKIRKIKTGIIDKNRQTAAEFSSNKTHVKCSKSETETKTLFVEEMNPAKAVAILEGEGLDSLLFSYDGQVYVVGKAQF